MSDGSLPTLFGNSRYIDFLLFSGYHYIIYNIRSLNNADRPYQRDQCKQQRSENDDMDIDEILGKDAKMNVRRHALR